MSVEKTDLDSVIWHKSQLLGPHEYILDHEYPELFKKLAKLVESQGVNDVFKGKTYKYFVFEGYRYWRLGDVLNRAKLSDI